jgi:hypothetical protein
MRFDSQKAFPYPVLRPHSDDYHQGVFEAIVDIYVDDKGVEVAVLFTLSVDEILDLVRVAKASFVLVVSCRDTYFREALVCNDLIFTHSFDINHLRGEVVVEPYVVANEVIESFSSQDINLEFGNGPFRFNQGDVIAQDEPKVFYIERDYFKPITSVFDLVKKDDLNPNEWTVSLSQDRVHIEVSGKMKETIDRIRSAKENRAILLNSIYFATVVHVVQQLKDAYGEYECYHWAEVVKRQIHNKGIDLDSTDAYRIAQVLMEDPLGILDNYVFQGGES